MPAAFDDMRMKIKANLKKQNPKMSEKELEKRSWAMATAQWKKAHGGKAPSRESWQTFEYFVPIQITEDLKDESKEFIIQGTAINETITRNNIKYTSEELEPAAHTLINKPILKDHRNSVDAIIGKVIETKFEDSAVKFKGRIQDKNIKEMIRDGRITDVSIGAKVKDLVKQSSEKLTHFIARGLEFLELSVVAVPGDPNANITQAIEESFKQKEFEENKEFFEEISEKEKKIDPNAEVRNRGDVVFPANSKLVNDKKDHFPINNPAQARNALARAGQFSASPPWFNGSLKQLQDAISRAVKRKYPNINVGGKNKKEEFRKCQKMRINLKI